MCDIISSDDFYNVLNEKRYSEQVDVPNQQDTEDFLMKVLGDKISSQSEVQVALIEGVDKWLLEYFRNNPEKVDRIEILRTADAFYEELKKPHAVRKRVDGVLVESGERKTFLETTNNPTMPKAMTFLKDVLRRKITRNMKGVPIEVKNMQKACSRFMTEYIKERGLHDAEISIFDCNYDT